MAVVITIDHNPHTTRPPLLLVLVFLFTTCTAFAFTGIPLEDFCAADLSSSAGGLLICKDPSKVTTSDFSFSGLHIPGNTSAAPGGVTVNFVGVEKIPGLYTQDLGFGRVDYAPGGLTPPHIHHKGAELITVMEGTLEVGFIASYPSLKVYNKVLNKGDVMVVPHGLVHYQRNVGRSPVVSYFFSGSGNEGLILVPNVIFGAKPEINTDYLSRAFQLDTNIIQDLQAKF